VLKCELDYICQNIEKKSYVELYERMKQFVTRAYPEDATEAHIGRELSTIGLHLINKKEYAEAVKLLRAAAEFCNDGQAQNYLGVLYNAGIGVEKNDLISLYWFDRATDNNFEAAKPDRDGLFNAYRDTLSEEEFVEYMKLIAHWCEVGTEDIPKLSELDSLLMRDSAVNSGLNFRGRGFASTVNEGRNIERLTGVSEDILGDGTCGFAEHVGKHIVELEIGDGETVLSAVLFAGNHVAEFGSVANQIAKLPDYAT